MKRINLILFRENGLRCQPSDAMGNLHRSLFFFFHPSFKYNLIRDDREREERSETIINWGKPFFFKKKVYLKE